MSYPDDFDDTASGAFPSKDELRREGRERMERQHAAALQRIDAALAALDGIARGLAYPEDCEWYDVDHSQSLADELEAFIARQGGAP